MLSISPPAAPQFHTTYVGGRRMLQRCDLCAVLSSPQAEAARCSENHPTSVAVRAILREASVRLLLPAVACCLSVSSLACCLSVGFSRPRPYGIFGRVVRRHSAMLRFYLSCCAILPFYSRPQLLTMWCPRPVCSRCRVCFRPRTHVARLTQSWVARSRRPSCPLAPPPCLTLNHPVSHAGCRSRPVICHLSS